MSGGAVLTVCIPFYRDLDYLREAIDSVRAQDDERWRLLVRDDGPEDVGAGDLVRGYGDPRIGYARHERNLGMVPSWNRCLDAADTELVCLLHGDDRLDPHYLRTVAALAGAHPEAVAVFCGARIVDGGGRSRFSLADAVKPLFAAGLGEPMRLAGESALRRVMAGNFIMCPTLCFRRERLGARRFAPRWRQAQDLELTSRLLLEGDTLVGTRAVAYTYRRHRESATEQQSESLLRFEEELALFAEVAERASERGWRRAAGTARHAAIVRLHLLVRIAGDLARGRVQAAGRKTGFLLRGSARADR